MYVDGNSGRGRPKKGGGVMANDMRKVGIREEDVGNRCKWKCRTRVADYK